ncbi:preprotein translocase subunit SecY [Patescibacteria group bacterium]|nr:preprotein translocase subunit SecY [Patescibacteria group bacterium]
MLKIFKNVELRKKLLFSALIIVVFRFLTHIPVPGVNLEAVRSYLSGNALFGIFDLFSGGALLNFSVVTLGLGPYINSSIIIQLFTKMIPSLEELSKEGEAGREKINFYTKLLTIPLSLIQAYGVYFLLSRQGVIGQLEILTLMVLLFTLVAGSMFMVWLGDLLTEYGLGQGTSLLIFVGIISQLPSGVLSVVSAAYSIPIYALIGILLLGLFVIVSVVMVNEGVKEVPIEYGRRGVRSEKVTNFLPIKINQAGVIPIIFAVSIVLVPSLVAGPLMAVSHPVAQKVGVFLLQNFSNTSLAYNILYFSLVFGFTFFYTFMQFDPVKIADDIKKRGGFVPGIRPGKSTESYLRDIIVKLTTSGAVFLGTIAILPYIVQLITGFSGLSIGGTGLLIVVSVVLDSVRQGQSLMVTKSYRSFLD